MTETKENKSVKRGKKNKNECSMDLKPYLNRIAGRQLADADAAAGAERKLRMRSLDSKTFLCVK